MKNLLWFCKGCQKPLFEAEIQLRVHVKLPEEMHIHHRSQLPLLSEEHLEKNFLKIPWLQCVRYCLSLYKSLEYYIQMKYVIFDVILFICNVKIFLVVNRKSTFIEFLLQINVDTFHRHFVALKWLSVFFCSNDSQVSKSIKTGGIFIFW